MIRKLREARENEEGFTLIELLVVVIIIGILAAIAIPAFLGQRDSANRAALTSDVRNAAIEVESEVTSENGAYLLEATGEPIVDGAEVSTANTTLDFQEIYDGTVLSGFCIVGTRPDVTDTIHYNSTGGGIMDPGAGNCTFGG